MPGIEICRAFLFIHVKKKYFRSKVSEERRMKYRYFAYLLLILFSACGGEKAGTVKVSGEIRGLGNDTLYIYGADKLYDRMDTIFAKDGKFSATLSPDTLVAAWLLFGNDTPHPLFMNKGDKIRIKGSVDDAGTLEISGNSANEELTAFLKEVNGIGKPSPKVMEEKAAQFIRNHPASLASIYLLDRYFIQQANPDYNQIKEFTDRMTGELKDRPFIDDLLDRMEEGEKAAIGKTAPYFNLPNAQGEKKTRSSFKDKYVLMHFWASWDTVSRDSNALYRRIYKKSEKDKTFALLGISLDLDKDKWQQAVKADSLEWEQVCDFSGWNTEVVKQLAVRNLPENIFLSPSGRIEGRNLSEADIEKKLRDIEEKEKAKKEREKNNNTRSRTRR